MSRARVAIALGSNLGDRDAHLKFAIHALSRDLSDLQTSPFIETPAIGPAGIPVDEPPFLNAVVVGLTAHTPRGLLERLLAIEAEQGRSRPYPMAPRTLDCDLILYDGVVVEEEGLVVPHPRFRERGFVLEPLAALAPDMVDPVTGLTIRSLLARLRAQA